MINRPAPALSTIDEDERTELHVRTVRQSRQRRVEGVRGVRHGFAKWYLETFTAGILEVILMTLDWFRQKQYVSPRVMTDCLNYLKYAVSHAYSWKMLKQHIVAVIQDVIFPLADEELWDSDQVDYIRQKFDVCDDYSTPLPAAEWLLYSVCKIRKDILNSVMSFIMQIITAPGIDVKQKDGALYMVSTLANVLLKKKIFKEQVEQLLTSYMFPEFASPFGHLRARACWVLHHSSDIKLAEIMRLTSEALLKVAENEDLTNVLQKTVITYSEKLMPIALNIFTHLASTFQQVLESDEGSDEKASTAMGLLNTMETLLSVMKDNPQTLASLHPVVHILTTNSSEYYAEAFSLIYDLASKNISPDMWKLLEVIYQLFQKDGLDYFVDMMPTLHNYVIVIIPKILFIMENKLSENC